MTDRDDVSATLTEDEIETHRFVGSTVANADDTGDTGDDAGDTGDVADTGDDDGRRRLPASHDRAASADADGRRPRGARRCAQDRVSPRAGHERRARPRARRVPRRWPSTAGRRPARTAALRRRAPRDPRRPAPCARASHTLETTPFTTAQLPGRLDSAGRLVLVRRLVREGFPLQRDI